MIKKQTHNGAEVPEQAVQRILANTYTEMALHRRLSLLQDFLEHARYGGGADDPDLPRMLEERYVGEDEREHARAVAAWGTEVIGKIAAGNMHERLRALKQHIDALPKMTLYVPIALEAAQSDAIGAWCRTNIHPEVMLDLRVDPSAAGGCALVWNDMLHDYSLGYFMRVHRHALAHVLEKYAPPRSVTPGRRGPRAARSEAAGLPAITQKGRAPRRARPASPPHHGT